MLIEKASTLLGSWLTDSIPVIGLGVGSKMSAKIWPLERYIQVVQNLSAMRSLRFVVLSGPEDEDAARSLINLAQMLRLSMSLAAVQSSIQLRFSVS